MLYVLVFCTWCALDIGLKITSELVLVPEVTGRAASDVHRCRQGSIEAALNVSITVARVRGITNTMMNHTVVAEFCVKTVGCYTSCVRISAN